MSRERRMRGGVVRVKMPICNPEPFLRIGPILRATIAMGTDVPGEHGPGKPRPTHKTGPAVSQSICAPRGRTGSPDAFEVVANSVQQDEKLAAFVQAQTLDGNF
jgi:hypothetical protein